VQQVEVVVEEEHGDDVVSAVLAVDAELAAPFGVDAGLHVHQHLALAAEGLHRVGDGRVLVQRGAREIDQGHRVGDVAVHGQPALGGRLEPGGGAVLGLGHLRLGRELGGELGFRIREDVPRKGGRRRGQAGGARETQDSQGFHGQVSLLQAFSCLASIGNERMRLPVAWKMALVTAGITGGRAGSPRPVGGLFDTRKVTSTSGAAGMRISGYWWKLLCTAWPLSKVTARARAWPMPSITEPWAWFMAPVGLITWLPMSPTSQTFSTLISPASDTWTRATSAK